MKYRSGSEVRQLFLDYFKSKGHMIEPGAPLVPVNDPTLLWINSGVAALKRYFDGSVKPQNNRITNAQKSIRTNDIDNVGKTSRHHTFFEMLGNFSIGDYFKEDAIKYAWEFLTSPEYIGMETDRMYVTVHPSDHEAYRIWVDVIGLDPKRILKSEENYWQIGEGPCGPNSEIYYDRGPSYDPENIGEELFFKELNNDRYIEVWNVVFSQYDGKEGIDRSLYKELPQKNIDTGMGLERLVCIVQDGETNFDTDLFLPVIKAVQKRSKLPYSDEYKMAYRVIADHIRTVTFALADGALFSNEGRGYVLRRLLRRAVRYGIKLGINGSFMNELVVVVAEMMKDYYPYVLDKTTLISKLVKAEEERFHKTLNAGEQLLIEELQSAQDKKLDGKTVFKLYDTFGFPVELTQEIASEKGFDIDLIGFKIEMEIQRNRARNAREDVESMSSQSVDLMNFTGESRFVGFDTYETTSTVLACFRNGQRVSSLDDEGDIIVELTPFYAEMGGQVADTGVIEFEGGEALVSDVQRAPHKQHLHTIKIAYGELKEDERVTLKIDVLRRQRIIANHSSAHLVQTALKIVVGDHIHQAGSYVAEDYMRFDFTHFEKVSDSQLKTIEAMVNRYIYEKHPVRFDLMDIEDAKADGATALFTEKYDKIVRVVSMGSVSKELCGGCHVSNTQEIGVFKIISEESIGSGIRRLTTKTQNAAYQEFADQQIQLENIAKLYKANSIGNIEDRIELSLKENSSLRQELGQLKQHVASMEAKVLGTSILNGKDFDYLIKRVDQDANNLKLMIESLKPMVHEGFILLAGVSEDKINFVAYCGQKAIAKGFKAGDVVKNLATQTGGNGGGRPDFAQAGGKDISRLDALLDQLRNQIL
ncbi:MAG: alanyl-tRNA synthetase [Erysipelotrichaceae bacterium]|nr:MAG: alanyl-tRNA [Erysipelotrichaceae bacterium]TXT17286.1 MAG: alanyl-tRNA synthetase [Erysipelotrichaceae bacterium]